MAKSLVLGNGNLLLGFDRFGQLQELYFPYAGLENHVGRGLTHRIGIHVDGVMSWLSEPGWSVTVEYEKETMVSNISARHEGLGVELRFVDAVYNEANIFLRTAYVKNLAGRERLIKLFFNQQFQISEYGRGDTAYYTPEHNAIIHYKGRRLFLISGKTEHHFFTEYSIGLFGIEGKEGTWRDAEDGVLTKNPIEHGFVDSVIAFSMNIAPGKEQNAKYWITVAESFREALNLHLTVQKRGVQYLTETTDAFWKAWVNKRPLIFEGLSAEVVNLFKKSLFIIRTHVDNRGGIIASGDSDILQGGRDTYAYVWPRDGAFTAFSLDKTGYFDISRRFYAFCANAVTEEGYLLHKYRCDGSLGSSWHPWIQGGESTPPIQEDETALPLIGLWEHYEATKDLEFIESLYNPFIKEAADFLVRYRNPLTGLPLPSFDLWEEHLGVHCFTASSVYAALVAAAKFSRLLGKEIVAQRYERVAEEMRGAIIRYFINPENGLPWKTLNFDGAKFTADGTLDSASAYGLFRFGILPPHDDRLRNIFEAVDSKLRVSTEVGGIARYEGDAFHRTGSGIPGNPWFICTLWRLEYDIARARNEEDLGRVRADLSWAAQHVKNAGILSEQLHPWTGEQISVAPLVWSHASFVLVVILYLEKLEELGVASIHPDGHIHAR